MQPGSYYVGDLCYVMDNDEWDEVCKLTLADESLLDGEFTLPDGRRFAMYMTSWGDGAYQDQTGNRYSVDSGTIGCIKWSDVKTHKYDHIMDLGVLHEFDSEFETSSQNGVIHIGRIAIDTDPEYDEDEDDYENEGE